MSARILFLMTRLHPFENGNGRFGRLWASVELMRAGHPVPVGFPTNDFMMSQRHIELEVRKAVVLGRMWEAMVKDAKKASVPPDQFFQKVYRGSALEGLTHVSPIEIEELAGDVAWLEKQPSPPDWAKELMKDIERRLYELHSTGGRIAKLTEADRSRLLAEAWNSMSDQLKKRNLVDLTPRNPKRIPRCSILFSGF